MLWRWFRDWREQRAALKELKQLQHAEERKLMWDQVNPLQQAKLALERDQPGTAAACWEDARERLPNVIYQSEDSLPILLGLKRYEEAEAFMQEGRRGAPRDRRWVTGLAQIAEHRGDYAEAVRRWKRAQKSGTSILGAWVRTAICLGHLGRYDEAEAAFNHVLRLHSTEVDALVGRTKLSEKRGDWLQAEARWRTLTEHLELGFVFAGHARALAELGRMDEAEAILQQACAVFPADLDIRTTRAHLAERRGDLTTACVRWQELQQAAPYFVPGYNGRADCLFNVERHAEADAVMRDAIERFPGEWWPLFEFARLASRRQDWHEAAARWEAFRTQFPDRDEGYGWGGAALHAAGRHEEAAALQRVP